jgi:hypothetical protein
MYPTFSSGLLYETGWENRTLLICLGDKEDQNLLSKTHYEYHSHFNIRSKRHGGEQVTKNKLSKIKLVK